MYPYSISYRLIYSWTIVVGEAAVMPDRDQFALQAQAVHVRDDLIGERGVQLLYGPCVWRDKQGCNLHP
jgi:hypothetical protein